MGRDISGRAVVMLLSLPCLVCYLLVLDPALTTYPHKPTDAEAREKLSAMDKDVSFPQLDEEDYWLDDWRQVQRRRRVALHSACFHVSRTRVKSLSRLLRHRRYLNNLLVDDRHRTIYCYVPKVACTNWKRIMMILSGRSNTTNPLRIRSNIPHEEGVLTRLSGSVMLGYKLRTYTKFLLVRHPMERLVSAYRNKLVKNSTSAVDFKKRFGTKILKKYRKGPGQLNASKSGHGVTFPEFISYLTDKGQHSYQSLNEHWAPYLELCHPCTIKYNIVGKYETLEKDADYILRKIGAPPYLHFPPVVTSRTPSLVSSHLASLPDTLLNRLYQLYKHDFRLFQYDIENY